MPDDSMAARAPSGTHDVLWPESTRWEALLAAFAAQVEAAGYGLAHTPIFEDVRVFRRGIGEGSDVVGKEMYEFEDRGRPGPGPPTGGDRTPGPGLRAAPAAAAVEGLVRHPGLPLRAAPGRPVPPAPPAGRRGPRPRGSRPRRRGGLAGRRLVPLVGPGRRSTSGSTRWATRCADRPTSTSSDRTWPSAGRQLCAEHRSGWRPTRSGSSTASAPACREATADAPALVDHLCDPCRSHFDRVQAGLTASGVPYRPRPPPGPGVRLLHPHHVRVLLRRPRRRPRTASAAVAATTAWSRCWVVRRRRASASASASSGSCWPATPRGCSRWRRNLLTPSSWTSPAAGRPATSPRRSAGPGCGPTGPSTTAR